MNYDFYLDLNEPVLLLENTKLNQSTRPQIGDVIRLANHGSKLFDIKRSVPSANPGSQKVTYYVLPHQDKLQKDNVQAQIERQPF